MFIRAAKHRLTVLEKENDETHYVESEEMLFQYFL